MSHVYTACFTARSDSFLCFTEALGAGLNWLSYGFGKCQFDGIYGLTNITVVERQLPYFLALSFWNIDTTVLFSFHFGLCFSLTRLLCFYILTKKLNTNIFIVAKLYRIHSTTTVIAI